MSDISMGGAKRSVAEFLRGMAQNFNRVMIKIQKMQRVIETDHTDLQNLTQLVSDNYTTLVRKVDAYHTETAQKLNDINKSMKTQAGIIQNTLFDQQQNKVAVNDLATRLSQPEAILG